MYLIIKELIGHLIAILNEWNATEPVDIPVVLRYSTLMYGLVELLTIIRALGKYRTSLRSLETHFWIYADHRSPEPERVTKAGGLVEVELRRLQPQCSAYLWRGQHSSPSRNRLRNSSGNSDRLPLFTLGGGCLSGSRKGSNFASCAIETSYHPMIPVGYPLNSNDVRDMTGGFDGEPHRDAVASS